MMRLNQRGQRRERLGAARWLLAGSLMFALVATGSPGRAEEDFGDELPRIDPLEPAEAVEAFEVAEGYRVELVAAEPLVTDPVAMAFDEDGRLFVAEMRGYSEQRDEGLGRIRVLEDTTGDGRMDHSTIFAEKLRWPTAVFPWDGGVFVGMAPDVVYLKDTTGDGEADHREVVFSGMAPEDLSRLNVQTLVNSLRWGLDNRVHGTPTRNTAIHPAGEPGEAIAMRNREFAFDPHTRELGFTSGGNQWGSSFDDWGRLFTCVNHDHNQMVAYEARYVARNPHLRAPSPRVSIGHGGQRADLFRVSPPEPWRVVRTRLRTTGQESGPVERGGELHGYVSAASSITIYGGDAYAEPMHGAAAIAAPDNNLVHRERLLEDGVMLRGERIDEQMEWLRTADNWFRPVWITHAPDGTLWVADMYREVIEHPWSLPESIKKHLDLNSGRDRGRIYRIVPEDFEDRPTPKLSEATTDELVELLSHANRWHRLTAARLLYERQDEDAVKPLRVVLRDGEAARGRLHAMYALDGLGALSDELLEAALGDAHPRVRENAMRLAEPRLTEAENLRRVVLGMADDAEIRVRYQVAFTLGEVGDAAAHEALGAMLERDAADRWVRLAAMSSLHGAQGRVLEQLMAAGSFAESAAGRQVIQELARQVGASGEESQLAAARRTLKQDDGPRRGRHAVLRGLARGMGLQGLRELLSDDEALLGGLAGMFETAAEVAADASAATGERTEAIGTLALERDSESADLLARLIEPAQPAAVQQAAMEALAGYRDGRVAERLIARWPRLGPGVRAAAMEALLARAERREAMVQALEEGRLSPEDVPVAYADRLRNDADAELAERAAAVLGEASTEQRAELAAEYIERMEGLEGDAERGRAVFTAACATCHEVQGEGHDLGANLMAFITRGRRALVQAVLNPNAEVDPQFANYLIETEDGQAYAGVITSESANTVTISPGGGVEQEVERSRIESMRPTRQSLMPEGLEGAIDPQQMADLAAFLEGAQ